MKPCNWPLVGAWNLPFVILGLAVGCGGEQSAFTLTTSGGTPNSAYCMTPESDLCDLSKNACVGDVRVPVSERSASSVCVPFETVQEREAAKETFCDGSHFAMYVAENGGACADLKISFCTDTTRQWRTPETIVDTFAADVASYNQDPEMHRKVEAAVNQFAEDARRACVDAPFEDAEGERSFPNEGTYDESPASLADDFTSGEPPASLADDFTAWWRTDEVLNDAKTSPSSSMQLMCVAAVTLSSKAAAKAAKNAGSTAGGPVDHLELQTTPTSYHRLDHTSNNVYADLRLIEALRQGYGPPPNSACFFAEIGNPEKPTWFLFGVYGVFASQSSGKADYCRVKVATHWSGPENTPCFEGGSRVETVPVNPSGAESWSAATCISKMAADAC
jgi:hypothetical protein